MSCCEDNPRLDGTPFEHPAYTRGNAAGAKAFARRVKMILDGKDDGAGVMGEPLLEEVRRLLLDAVKRFDKTNQQKHDKKE